MLLSLVGRDWESGPRVLQSNVEFGLRWRVREEESAKLLIDGRTTVRLLRSIEAL